MKDWVGRIVRSFWQGAVAAAGVAQVVDAVSNGDLPLLGLLGLAALGGGTAAAVSALRIVLTKPPVFGGAWAVVERAVWTFVAAAVGAIPTEALAASITNTDLRGLRSVILIALGGGIGALLSTGVNMSESITAPKVYDPGAVKFSDSGSGGIRIEGSD